MAWRVLEQLARSQDPESNSNDMQASIAENLDTNDQPRVLVAEDDADMRRLIASVLRRDGYEVVEVTSGIELFECVELSTWGRARDAFDVIVTDVQLPDLSGLEVLAAFRCRAWNPRVVLVTAFGDDRMRQEARDLGVNAILDKPLVVDDLRAAVRALLLRGRRRRRGS